MTQRTQLREKIRINYKNYIEIIQHKY